MESIIKGCNKTNKTYEGKKNGSIKKVKIEDMLKQLDLKNLDNN